MRTILGFITISFMLIFAQNKPTNIINTSKGLWGDKPKVELKFAGHFGEEDSEEENLMFVGPISIKQDKNGNYFVLEGGKQRIKKFDKNFKFIKNIGRSGKGPGEFVMANDFDIDSKGNLYVSDSFGKNLQVLDNDGKYLKSIKIRAGETFFRVINDDKLVLFNSALGYAVNAKELSLFHIIDHNGKIEKRIGQGNKYTKFPYREGGNRLTFTFSNNEIVTAFLFQNRIEKYNLNGDLIFSASREIKKDKILDKELGMFHLLSKGIDIDSKGRIWNLELKRRPQKGETAHRMMYMGKNGVTEKVDETIKVEKTDMFALDLFNKNGEFLYRFNLNHFASNVNVLGNKIFVCDAENTMRFFVYEIIEK